MYYLVKKFRQGVGIIFMFMATGALADDGYRLWLKFDPVSNAADYKPVMQFLRSEFPDSPVAQTAGKELRRGLQGLLGVEIPDMGGSGGGIIFRPNPQIPDEGYLIKMLGSDLVIGAATDRGLLYGVYALLRHIQTGSPLSGISIKSSPKIALRMLNHWDNMNGSIERGYAGSSLWKWYELPETIDPRYEEYARANASVGINAVVLNNVNASPRVLSWGS